jgi:hypothetical protein
MLMEKELPIQPRWVKTHETDLAFDDMHGHF